MSKRDKVVGTVAQEDAKERICSECGDLWTGDRRGALKAACVRFLCDTCRARWSHELKWPKPHGDAVGTLQTAEGK